MTGAKARSPWPTAVSVGMHAGALALLIIGVGRAIPVAPSLPPSPVISLQFVPPPPPPAAAPPQPAPVIEPPPVLSSTSATAPVLAKPPPKRKKQPVKPPPPAPPVPAVAAPAETVPAVSNTPPSAVSAPDGVPGNPPVASNPAGPPADYLGLLSARLSMFKDYPLSARSRGIQGVVRMVMVLGRDGTLLDVRLQRGSGSDILDRAALGMAKRASPFPPLPASHEGATMEVLVPVPFRLR